MGGGSGGEGGTGGTLGGEGGCGGAGGCGGESGGEGPSGGNGGGCGEGGGGGSFLASIAFSKTIQDATPPAIITIRDVTNTLLHLTGPCRMRRFAPVSILANFGSSPNFRRANDTPNMCAFSSLSPRSERPNRLMTLLTRPQRCVWLHAMYSSCD